MTPTRARMNRDGGVAIYFSFAIVGMMGMLSLSMDIGAARVASNEVQYAVDAAAYAGAGVLDQGPSAVRSAAKAVALQNKVRGDGLHLDNDDIKIGFYHTGSGGSWFSVDEANGDAVLIQATADQVDFLFARLYGFAGIEISRQAVAASFGGGSDPGGGDLDNCGWPNCGIITLDELDSTGSSWMNAWDYQSSPTYSDDIAVSDGGLCSNGMIDATGSTDIMGDVAYGPDGDASVTGSAYVDGEVYEMSNSFDLADVELGDVATNNDNGNISDHKWYKGGPSLKSNGPPTQLSMPAGDYYLTGIDISGNPSNYIHADGEVVIYLEGDMSLNGASSTGDDPGNLTIMVSGDHDIVLNGKHDFYGTIYAPESNVTLNGTADVYGQIIAKSVLFSGTGDLHFPLNMGNPGVDWCAGVSGEGIGGVTLLE